MFIGEGPAGDLRGRASRMVEIDSLDALAAILEPLQQEGFVERIDPAPGSRAERWVQLLSPGLHPTDVAVSVGGIPAPASPLAARVEILEAQVAELKDQVRALLARG